MGWPRLSTGMHGSKNRREISKSWSYTSYCVACYKVAAYDGAGFWRCHSSCVWCITGFFILPKLFPFDHQWTMVFSWLYASNHWWNQCRAQIILHQFCPLLFFEKDKIIMVTTLKFLPIPSASAWCIWIVSVGITVLPRSIPVDCTGTLTGSMRMDYYLIACLSESKFERWKQKKSKRM